MGSLEGTYGAKYTIAHPCRWPHEVTFRNWRVQFLKDKPAVMAIATEALAVADLPGESYRAVQKALDLMSIGGGGHFQITDPWDARMLWWPADDGLHLRLTDDIFLPSMPYAMFVTEVEGAQPGDFHVVDKSPRWHEGFRHFRRAQISTDPFSAFGHMFLAFESLLSARVEKERRENEKEWLSRALELMGGSYSSKAREELLSPRAIESFLNEVYEEVRCGVFHAKQSRGPILPLGAESAPKVERALRTITWHVIELAREHQTWAPNARPQMEHELFEHGRWLRSGPTVLVSADASKADANEVVIKTQRSKDLSTPSTPVFSGTALLEQFKASIPHISGMRTVLSDGGSATTELGLGFVMDGVSHVSVDVGIRMGFSQMVRSIYPVRSGR